MDSTIYEAISEYYVLKKKYDDKKKDKKRVRAKDEIDFSNKDNTLTAIGSSVDIQIIKGTYTLYETLLNKLKKEFEKIANEIVNTKMEILFHIVDETNGIDQFHIKKEQLDEIIKKKQVILESYEKMLSRNDRDIQLEKEKVDTAMILYDEDMNDYIQNKNVVSLRNALDQCIKIIYPSNSVIRNFQNDIYRVDYDEQTEEYIVCNEVLSLENREILNMDSKKPTVVNNKTSVSKDTSESSTDTSETDTSETDTSETDTSETDTSETETSKSSPFEETSESSPSEETSESSSSTDTSEDLSEEANTPIQNLNIDEENSIELTGIEKLD